MSGIDMRDEWAKMDNDAIASLEIEKGVMQARIYELESDNERMKAALEMIANWAQAYPPESLSQQSTSDIPSIRYKIKLVERIAREGLGK